MSLWDDIADSDLMDTFSSVATDVGSNVLTNLFVTKQPTQVTQNGTIQQTPITTIQTNNPVPTNWMKNPFGLPLKQPALNWAIVGVGIIGFVLLAKKVIK